MLKAKGFYEWKLVNADTNETDLEGSQWNTVSDRMLSLLCNQTDLGASSYLSVTSQSFDYRIQLSDEILNPATDYRVAGLSDSISVLVESSDLNLTLSTVDYDNNSFWLSNNFGLPGSTRTIRLIGLRMDYTQCDFNSFIELSTPITQNTNQYLYVKYTFFASYLGGGFNVPDNRYLNFGINRAILLDVGRLFGSSSSSTTDLHLCFTRFLPPSDVNKLMRDPAIRADTYDDSHALSKKGSYYSRRVKRDFATTEHWGPVGALCFAKKHLARAYISTQYTQSSFQATYGYSPIDTLRPSFSRVFAHPVGRESQIFNDAGYPPLSQGVLELSGIPNNIFNYVGKTRITKTGDASDVVDDTFTVSGSPIDDIIMDLDQDWAVNDIVRVTGGSLPSPLVIDTDYYIVYKNTTTTRLSTSEGGSAITLTSDGSGTMVRQNTGQYVVEASPWAPGDFIYQLSMGIDVDNKVMPHDLGWSGDPGEGGTAGAGPSISSYAMMDSMIEGCSELLGGYLYTVQKSRYSGDYNMCRWLWNTLETSEALCKFGDSSTRLRRVITIGTKLYIGTNQGIFEYDTTAPTTSPTLLVVGGDGLIDSNIKDMAYDSVTTYLWAGHDTGLTRIDLAGPTGIQYTTATALSGMSTYEIRICAGQLTANNGRVVRGGRYPDMSSDEGSYYYDKAWVLEDGVGWYNVMGIPGASSSYHYGVSIVEGTTQVFIRRGTDIRLYDVTVTGAGTGSASLVSPYPVSVENILSYCYGPLSQIYEDTFVDLYSYNPGDYNYVIRVAVYKLDGTSSVTNYGTAWYSRFNNCDATLYGGTLLSRLPWFYSCWRTKIALDNGMNIKLMSNVFFQVSDTGRPATYGWNGSSWEYQTSPTPRKIQKTGTMPFLDDLSLQFNNATGKPWDEQFIEGEQFTFGYGPMPFKDNLQTMSMQGKYFYCDARGEENAYDTIGSGEIYEISSATDPNFRDIDSDDDNARIYEIPASQSFSYSDVTDILTVAEDIPTGSKVLLYSDNDVLPDPLVEERIYYAINVSPTEIRLAYSVSDASNNTYINILTTPGVGVTTYTLPVQYSYVSISGSEEEAGGITADLGNNWLEVDGAIFQDGTTVQFKSDNGVLPSPLSEFGYYYVIYVDDTTIQVSSTPGPGSPIDILPTAGVGNITIYTQQKTGMFKYCTIDTGTDLISMDHPFPVGSLIRLKQDTGLTPFPLVNDTWYYAIPVAGEHDHVQVAETYQDALSNTPIIMAGPETPIVDLYRPVLPDNSYGVYSSRGHFQFSIRSTGKTFRLTYMYTMRG